jgi:serine/threonine protein phosphatase PrpC
MTPTLVEDSEFLFRSVRSGGDEYRYENGTLHISSQAFRDFGNKPSVDRNSLRSDPKDAKLTATDGVCQVLTQEVRAICHIRQLPNEKDDKSTYGVDAIHRPREAKPPNINENKAHCQIECSPEIANTHFKKLKEALAKLANKYGWIVPPAV